MFAAIEKCSAAVPGYRVVCAKRNCGAGYRACDESQLFGVLAGTHKDDQMFSGLVHKLVENGFQPKVNIYDESKLTVNVYADDWQHSLRAIKTELTNAFVTRASVV